MAASAVSLGSVVSAACAAAAWWVWPSLPLIHSEADIRAAVPAILGMDATMLGFLVSTGALVFAVAQTTLMRNLYRTGHVQRLLAALFVDAGWFLGALSLAFACTLMQEVGTASLRVLAALNVGGLVGLIPVAHTMWHLLVNAGPPDSALEVR